jgi:L-ascorbate metabolism protein UlaG (beta-lactamase superfamily)
MNAFECGNYAEAMKICELWESGLPNEAGPQFSKARIYSETGQTDQAILCYEKALQLAPEGRSADIARQRIQELQSTGGTRATISIRWLGHASYIVTTSDGTTFLTDPINFRGYQMPTGTTADIVTVSHEHIDHNATDALSGSPLIFRGTDDQCRNVNAIDTTVYGVRVYSVPSFHDPGHHGRNAVFVFEFDDIRLAHLGDIGTTLSADQISAIGEADILMLPVGGQFTVSGAAADSIVNQLDVSRFVLPMHYRTDAFDAMPYTVELFLEGKENVIRQESNEFTFDLSESERERKYVVLQY